jgi:polyisoprenoid-binding protein YceI
MPWEWGVTHSQIAWECRYLGIMTIKGLFTRADVTVNVEGDNPSRWSVAAMIDAASIESGNERRDNALRGPDYLDIEQYPTIGFQSTGFARQGDHYQASGDLTIHGVTRPIALDLAYQGEAAGRRGEQYRVLTTSFSLNRLDFGVGQPANPPGGGVAEEIRISLQAELVLQP